MLADAATDLGLQHRVVVDGVEAKMVCAGAGGKETVVDMVAEFSNKSNLADGLAHAEHVLLQHLGVPCVVVWEEWWCDVKKQRRVVVDTLEGLEEPAAQ